MQKQTRKHRTILTACCVLAALLTVGIAHLSGFGRRYYLLSLLLIFYTLLPFFWRFEQKRPSARELVLLASFAAAAALGRVLFAATPQIKPMAALVILAGMCLGTQGGFVVGALAVFVSNFYFSQGVWTPWQMFGFGMLGLCGGILPKLSITPRRPLACALAGGILVLVVYGGMMNPASVIMYTDDVTVDLLLASYVTGLQPDLIHAASTAVFLLVLSAPVGKKLERIRTKYGLFME